MRKQLFAAAAGVLLLCSQSQGKEDGMQTHIDSYQLENGLTIIAKPVHHAPVVSVYMWYCVGSRNEEAGQSGLAHFLEHMLFKGTQQFPKGEISRQVERTGGQQNAFTSYDYTAFYETVPREHLELALKIEADRMHNALLDPKEFEQERTVILSELDGNRNYPQVRFRDLMNAQTWLTHPYRRPIIGWREEVEALTVQQLRHFYETYYFPGNAALVVVGDFQPEALRALVRQYYQALPAKARPQARLWPKEKQQGQRQVVLKDFGAAAMVQINLPVPPAGDADHYALTVLNEALTKGKTARLYKSLVDKGLATSVSGAPNEMIDPGVWTIRATCQRGVDPAQVEQVLLKEISNLQTHELSAAEFKRAVVQTRADLVYSRDSLTDQAMMLGYYQTVASDWRLADLYPARVAAVKPEQLRQAAKKYLDPDQMTIGRFVPLAGQVPAGGNPGLEGPLSLKPSRLGTDLPLLPPVAGAVPAGDGSVGSNPGCKRYVLANGLTLLVQANPSNPMLVVTGLVKGGTSQEPANKPGLAAMHAEMLDRGTQQRSAAQIADALEERGIELAFSEHKEFLEIGGEALAEDLELTLDFLADMLLHPAFPAAEVEKARKKILTSCLLAQDNSDLQAWQGFYSMAYPAGHPMARSLLTAEAGVKKISRDDLLAYHQERIRPQDTILSISGDVDPEKTHHWVEQYFSAWHSGNWQPAEITPMEPVKATQRKKLALRGKTESIVVFGHEGILRSDPEYYQAFVANQVLGGGGFSNLLMQEVRDREGLTYSIYSQFKLSKQARPWCVTFQADPGKVEKAIEVALEQVRHLQKGEVKESLFKDNQERLVGSLALSLENNSGMAYLNREVEYHQLGTDYFNTYAKSVRAVSFQDMLAAAKKWFHPDACLFSIAEPTAENGKEK